VFSVYAYRALTFANKMFPARGIILERNALGSRIVGIIIVVANCSSENHRFSENAAERMARIVDTNYSRITAELQPNYTAIPALYF
jgi:hypothetical protein